MARGKHAGVVKYTLVCSLALAVGICASAVSAGCGKVKVLRSMPKVAFERPRGAVMYLSVGGQTLRVRFDGKARVFPLVCEARPWLVNPAGPPQSVKHTMAQVSRSRGYVKARLFSKEGKLLLWGRLCIFPTFDTRFKKILKKYTVRIPVKKLLKRPPGATAVLFQTYPPIRTRFPGHKHVAWVLFIAP